jgi:cytochrome b involved in lipid metabolism
MGRFFNKHCYIKIGNKWYDMKPFFKIHPGGDIVLKKYKNTDATVAFYSIDAHYHFYHALEKFLVTDENVEDKLNNKLLKKINKKIKN